MRTFPFLLIPLLALVGTVRGGAAPRPDVYMPLVEGSTFTYQVTTTVNSEEAPKKERTLTIDRVERKDGQTLAWMGDEVFTMREDGVYLYGTVADKQVKPLETPRRWIGASPKIGDKWEQRTESGRQNAAVVGAESVKVPAGEFETFKVYIITVADGRSHEEYRWFAPEVGMVKSTTTQRSTVAGKVTTTQITSELARYRIGKADDPTVLAKSAQALVEQGQALARDRNHAAALARYDAAIAADPKLAKAHAYRALSLLATRQGDAAQKSIDRAVELDPKNYLFHEIAGQVQLAQGRVEQAIPLYDKAATLAPKNAGAVYMDLAALLSARNDKRLAPSLETALKKSAAADPPHPEALFALGQMYVGAGRVEGKAYLQRYLDLVATLPDEQRDARKIRLAKQLIRAIESIQPGAKP